MSLSASLSPQCVSPSLWKWPANHEETRKLFSAVLLSARVTKTRWLRSTLQSMLACFRHVCVLQLPRPECGGRQYHISWCCGEDCDKSGNRGSLRVCLEGSLDACWLVGFSSCGLIEQRGLRHTRRCAWIPSSYRCSTLPLCHLTTVKGPKSNAAKLPVASQQTIYELFAQIFRAAIATATDKKPVRYLSR